jgi:hypothetical protein
MDGNARDPGRVERSPLPGPAAASASRAGLRWAIWLEQMARGAEPCFGTDRRYACADAACPYRDRCFTLQADWLR